VELQDSTLFFNHFATNLHALTGKIMLIYDAFSLNPRGKTRPAWLFFLGKSAIYLFFCLGATNLSHGVEGKSYFLREMDTVSVQVYGEADLNKVQRIDGEGRIRVNLIGTVKIAGLTLREAEEHLQEAFIEKKFLRNPQVSVQVEKYAPYFISILGEVQKPGRVKLEEESNRIRLVDAISAVGGFKGIAKANAVRITRMAEDGSEINVIVDAESLINGEITDIPSDYLDLLPGDVVYVPERLF